MTAEVTYETVAGLRAPDAADGRALRDVYGRFPSGVVAVCAEVEGERIGMAVSSFTSVSLEPALVSVCLDRGSSTWPRLRRARRLGVSVLGAGHAGVARQLASRSGDRFAGLDVETADGGAVLLPGASAWFDTRVHGEVDAGDHVVVLLEVVRFGACPDEPLVFHGSAFRALT
ncbi:flavin reductase family protein [Nocardioides sp. C4-1]|uniref:flavin reductase family protein n=1 Tax=Nocardioides sp. C4-1 TaxID=3151851 RepID=UPI003267E8C3